MSWRNQENSWGRIAILLHFGVAAIVFGLFALGWWMTSLSYYDPWYKQGPDIHRSIGILLFLALIIRVVWRLIDPAPHHLDSHSKLEQIAAKATHGILYILMFLIMGTGYLISTADGRAISVFDWFDVPATLQSIPNQEDVAGLVHWYGALFLMGLVALHIAGVLKHHLIDKDETLRRMLGKSQSK